MTRLRGAVSDGANRLDGLQSFGAAELRGKVCTKLGFLQVSRVANEREEKDSGEPRKERYAGALYHHERVHLHHGSNDDHYGSYGRSRADDVGGELHGKCNHNRIDTCFVGDLRNEFNEGIENRVARAAHECDECGDAGKNEHQTGAGIFYARDQTRDGIDESHGLQASHHRRWLRR